MANLVAPAREVGNFDTGLNAAPYVLCGISQPPHGDCNGCGKQHREHHHHAGCDQCHLDDCEAFGLHDFFDIAALRLQEQHAAHGAEALDRHCHGHDYFALVVDGDAAV